MIEAQRQAFLESLSQGRNYSPRTISAYLLDLSQFEEFLRRARDGRAVDLALVDLRLLRRFLGELMDAGLSPRSVARKVACLKSFFRYLRRKGVVSSDPTSLLSPPKAPKRNIAHPPCLYPAARFILTHIFQPPHRLLFAWAA